MRCKTIHVCITALSSGSQISVYVNCNCLAVIKQGSMSNWLPQDMVSLKRSFLNLKMFFALQQYVNALTETKSHMLLVTMVTVNGVTSQKQGGQK